MKKILLMLTLLTVVLLSGCWDEEQPERMYYIQGVGVDYKDGQYEIFVQIIDFANVAKTESPNPEAIQVEIGTAKGETVTEAFMNLYHTLDLKLFWGHLTFILLSEEVLDEGRIKNILTLFTHYRETRYTMWYYATDGDLKELLLTTPILNRAITMSKLADPDSSYKQESFPVPITMRDLVIDLNEPGHEIVLPFFKVSENWETEKGTSKSAKADGVAVFNPSKYKGNLTGEDAYGLVWMTKETKRGQVTVGNNQDAYTVIIEDFKLKVDAVEQSGNLKFNVKVNVNALLSTSNRDVSEKEIKAGVEKKIKEQIEKTYTLGLEKDMDIYRLSEIAYRQKLKVWKKIQEDGAIPLTEDSLGDIKVTVEKINTGRKNFDLLVK